MAWCLKSWCESLDSIGFLIILKIQTACMHTQPINTIQLTGYRLVRTREAAFSPVLDRLAGYCLLSSDPVFLFEELSEFLRFSRP